MTSKISIVPEPSIWRRQLQKRHWRVGYSACSVAHSWHLAQGLPSEISRMLGGNSRLICMEPEHPVAMPGYSGPSWCDVFARVEVNGSEWALVIEAKVDENFGESVGKWRRGGSSKNSLENREYRLENICKELGLSTDISQYEDLRYDLFHTTLAAVRRAKFLDAKAAVMIVQSFSPHDTGFAEFEEFCRLFDVQPEVNVLHEIAVLDCIPLSLGWARCPPPPVDGS